MNIKKNSTGSRIETLKINALSETCKLIGRAVHLETTLQLILKVLHDSLQMERATLVLLDSGAHHLSIRASYGLTVEEEQRGVYGLSEGICGQIFQSGMPCVVPDITKEPLFLNRTKARSKISKKSLSFIGVPIEADGATVGVLTVDRLFGPEISFEEDISFLEILVTIIGQFLMLHKAINQQKEKLAAENRSLKAELHGRFSKHYIIGNSMPMQKVYRNIEKVAPSRATALLLGESGTGKELVARAIHEASPRKGAPFIKVNCAALPENLLESELFGHDKGAFTGATATKPGRFELADGGTIFLDEIGEMSLFLQAKLLRVLQEKQFERLGSTRTLTVDVRVIAATNADLESLVSKGMFRADLFYRLNVVPLRLPALRERREDIPLLLDHFLSGSNKRNGREIRLTQDTLTHLTDYSWPGNVRELQNLVERMVILSEQDIVDVKKIQDHLDSLPRLEPVKEISRKEQTTEANISRPASFLADLERQEIETALRRNGWVQARAAKELGLTQRQIGYRIKKLGLVKPGFAEK